MLASYFSFGKYLHLIALTLRGAYAYTWSLKNAPSQCGQLNIAIAGDGGAPPFHILIAPFGPSPLPNSIDARAILEIPLPDSKREIDAIREILMCRMVRGLILSRHCRLSRCWTKRIEIPPLSVSVISCGVYCQSTVVFGK